MDGLLPVVVPPLCCDLDGPSLEDWLSFSFEVMFKEEPSFLRPAVKGASVAGFLFSPPRLVCSCEATFKGSRHHPHTSMPAGFGAESS